MRAGQSKSDIHWIAVAVRRSDRASVHDIDFSQLYPSLKTFANGYAQNMLFTGVLCVASAVGSYMRLRGSGTTPVGTCPHTLRVRPFPLTSVFALFLFLFWRVGVAGCKQYLCTLSTVGIP